jgi:hypothetical protein
MLAVNTIVGLLVLLALVLLVLAFPIWLLIRRR